MIKIVVSVEEFVKGETKKHEVLMLVSFEAYPVSWALLNSTLSVFFTSVYAFSATFLNSSCFDIHQSVGPIRSHFPYSTFFYPKKQSQVTKGFAMLTPGRNFQIFCWYSKRKEHDRYYQMPLVLVIIYNKASHALSLSLAHTQTWTERSRRAI